MFISKLHAVIVTALVAAALGTASLAYSDGDKQDTVAPANQKSKVDEQAIRALIKQLGDESYEKREAAGKRLEATGEPALELLKKAAEDDPDSEVRARARALGHLIGKSFFQEVRHFEGHGRDPLGWATRVVVTPDGRFAVTAGSGMMRYWDIETGKQLLAFGQSKRFKTMVVGRGFLAETCLHGEE